MPDHFPSVGYLLKVPYDSPWDPSDYNRGVRVMRPGVGTGTVVDVVSYDPLLYRVRWDRSPRLVRYVGRATVTVVASR